MEIIYLDETGCFLDNNNYKDWPGKEELVVKGPEKDCKEKYNIIMAINTKRIIKYEIIKSNIDSKIFGAFIDGLIKNLSPKEKENSILIMDNARCHKSKELIKKYKI